MEISVRRVAKRDTYTIGRLYIDGIKYCDTLEDKDRGLKQTMSVKEIENKKVYGQTAIPTGRYEVIINWSNKFKQYMPLLLNVPGYSGIRIHSGNTDKDTLGCILVGYNTVVGKVLNSKSAYKSLFAKIKQAAKNEKIYITIE